ncbi:GNAT family N-acetyltransferase [Sphingomonas montana]|uniref:GNAT family N-acetyltransferase n=1 Tax=Sphingomonas montana TaxID=1843236 RepID=UPI00096EB8A3|nr:GNAT family N-acetyltransferase [Sphingomonas montana]
MTIEIRPLADTDIAAALVIQTASYPSFLIEDDAAFASRIAFSPNHSLAAVQSGRLAGYVLAHSWVTRSPPAIGTTLDPNVATDGTLFIHDLAVAGFARGTGLARRLVDHVMALASRHGMTSAELIAVEGAARFWHGMGFAEDDQPDLAGKVAAYGDAARYMVRPIPPGSAD